VKPRSLVQRELLRANLTEVNGIIKPPVQKLRRRLSAWINADPVAEPLLYRCERTRVVLDVNCDLYDRK
jgi:hypothetical protein